MNPNPIGIHFKHYASGKAPCTKDCPDRCVTCHTTCEKYIAWKAGRADDLQKARDAAEHKRVLQEYYKDMAKRQQSYRTAKSKERRG